MQELVREYLNELGKKQRKRRRTGIIAAAFAIVVAGGVIWGLIQSGIAMTGEAKCGMEEHTHGDGCYTDTLICGQEESAGHIHGEACYQTEQVLVCGQEEGEEHTHGETCYQTEQVLICGQEESEGHTHTDACYSEQLTCGKQEHIHTDACFIDNGADVEAASQWDAQYQDIKWENAWGRDLVTAAQKQIGYKESTRNYAIAADGSHKGYTRYGQFAGDVYADWDAAFVNFCLHYAGLEASQMFPNEKLTAQWHEKLVTVEGGKNKVYLTTPDGYEPEAGDLIFFQKEGEETETQMGIVASYDKEKNEVRVIEGNSGNEVKENKYSLDDKYISEYLMVTEMEKAYKETQGADEDGENADETADGTVFTTEDSEDAQATGEEEDWAYEESYDADKVIIHVSAKEGVVPEGAELSVTPIEKKEVTDGMSRKEAKETEEINAQYELTEKKLLEESEKKEEILEGFLAYDICFLVDGEEVEPSGDVKVTMDFKEAVKPEGVSENATVVVNHLKADESAEDGVKVEDLTSKETTTIVTAKEDASIEKVELVADTFSVFTIVYVSNFTSFYPQITVEIVDERGTLIKNDNEEVGRFDFGNDSQDIECDLTTQFENQIKTEAGYYNLSQIKIVDTTQGSEKLYDAKSLKMSGLNYVFSDSEGAKYSYGLLEVADQRVKIRLIYTKGTAIGIKDDVIENGKLQVIDGDAIINQYPDCTYKYVWLKSVNGMEYEEVESIRYGDMYTVSSDGELLDVALDNGGLSSSQRKVEYKVRLEITAKNGEELEPIESKAFSVPYYSEVYNGSFELPSDPTLVWDEGQCFVDMEMVPGWSTTAYSAKGRQIEIVRSTMGMLNYFYAEHFWADDGVQFAEINAESDGALYQDVLTVKDRPLKYYFSHRARKLLTVGKTDENGIKVTPDKIEDRDNSMYVVIAPTKLAESGINGSGPIDTNDEVTKLMEAVANPSVVESPEERELLKGVYVAPYTTHSGFWKRYEGDYTPISNMTRFFFVSNQNDTQTMGNFIDRVSFSQTVPAPTTNTFNLSVKKTIVGLEGDQEKLEELKEKLTFEIEVKDSSDKYVSDSGDVNGLLKGEKVILKASDMEWFADKEGSYTGFYNYVGNLIEGTYTVTVTERSEDLAGYEVEIGKESVVSTPQTVTEGEDAGKVINKTIDSNKSSSIQVSSKQNVTITHTNTYISKSVEPEATKKISVIKKWEDFDNAYGTRGDDLKLKLTLAGKYTDGSLKEITEEDFAKWDIDPRQEITADTKGDWGYTWEEVPVYYGNDKTKPITWTVTELVIGSNKYKQKDYEITKDIPELTDGSNTVTNEADERHTFINVLKAEEIDWSMVKYSTSGKSTEVTLEGAHFELRKDALQEELVATGESKEGEKGVISWKQTSGKEGLSPLSGDFVIVETQAPEGFSLTGTRSWKVKLVNGIPYVDGSYDNVTTEGPNENGITIYIGNTPLYSLPESGGSGIYWYMFGGILLMAGAALITYKKRCREVLKG